MIVQSAMRVSRAVTRLTVYHAPHIENLEMYLLEFVQIKMVMYLNTSFNLGDHRYDDIKTFKFVQGGLHFCVMKKVSLKINILQKLEI